MAIIGVTNTRKDILGSFSMQGSGQSEQKIVKIVQAQYKQEIYVLTSKDKIIKLKIDHSGTLFETGVTFKIPRPKPVTSELSKIVAFCQCDNYFIFGLNNGDLEFYELNHLGALI